MYGDDGVLTTLFLIVLGILNLLSYLSPLLVVFFIVWMIRKPRGGPVVPQPIEYPPGILALQQLLQILAQSSGTISFGQRSQFVNSFLLAQNELNQLDGLRRQQSELRLGDMRTEAASMGIFLN